MTTTVTVTTHGWAADVTARPVGGSVGDPHITRIAPNSEQSFAVYSGMDISVHEIPKEKYDASDVKTGHVTAEQAERDA